MIERKYTESQIKAIEWGEGPVVVIAGPGSGKTAVLTERIIRIIEETPEDSFRILALTFTNKAAAEMAERISDRVKEAISRVFIGTFHSFCADVLRNHGSYARIRPDYEIYSSTDDLNDIVEDLKKKYYYEVPGADVENLKILNAIQYFEKNLCLTEEDVDKVMPNTPYRKELKWFYFEYLQALEAMNVLDFDALILHAYRLFATNPNIARLYRSTYRFINIDEFQDTNYGQYILIKSLAGEKNKNLFIVADDDQVIYGWNGANHKRINEFKEEYKAELIQLYQNFRCPPEVVKLANHLISHNSGRTIGKKPLESMKETTDEQAHIFFQHFLDETVEAEAVANLIMKLQEENSDESICVLARNNRLLENAFNKAREKKINCENSKRKDEFETTYVLWMYLLLKLANRRTDERILSQVVAIMDSNKQILDSEQMVLEAQLSNGDLLKALLPHIERIINDAEFFKSIQLNLCEGKNFLKFIDDAFVWSEKRINLIVNEEHRDQALQEFNLEKKAWRDFQRKLGYTYSLDEIVLSTYMQEFAMISKDVEPEAGTVQFLTIHASKGKEFDHVILIGMVDDELPSFQSIKKGDCSPEMEEERRNCFVAITRTKKRLYLTYAEKYFGWPKKVSRFMKEMFPKQ